jgi:hypothetical protein
LHDSVCLLFFHLVTAACSRLVITIDRFVVRSLHFHTIHSSLPSVVEIGGCLSTSDRRACATSLPLKSSNPFRQFVIPVSAPSLSTTHPFINYAVCLRCRLTGTSSRRRPDYKHLTEPHHADHLSTRYFVQTPHSFDFDPI